MRKLVFLFLLCLFPINFAFADELIIDWTIEGQSIKEDSAIKNQIQPQNPMTSDEEIQETSQHYTEFVTGNSYAIGDYKISIDSPEGQALNKLLIEQQDLQDDNFKHKIKYYDRFSDGYVQVAEALLDPIGNSKYIINGRSLDFNPNSNLEIFVLERGYSLDDLESIPNDIFSPMKCTGCRQLIVEAARSGSGQEIDLRVYSPNALNLTPDQIQEKLLESLSGQTAQLQNEIFSEINVRSSLQNPSVQDTNDIFAFNIPQSETSRFEDTQRIRDLIQSNPNNSIVPQIVPEMAIFWIIPVFVALGMFGYYIFKRNSNRKTILLPQIEYEKPQEDFKEKTMQLLEISRNAYRQNNSKHAFDVLSAAIRYYYSQKLGILKEISNYELVDYLTQGNITEKDQIKQHTFMCASVGYAKYEPTKDEFENTINSFERII